MTLIRILFAAFLGCTCIASGASQPTQVYNVDWRSYQQVVLTNLVEHGFKVPELTVVPALRLFGPDGKMLLKSSDVESGEAILAGAFPPSQKNTPLKDEPDWSLFADAIDKSVKSGMPDSLKGGHEGTWTLLLVSTDLAACRHCAPFEKSVLDLGRNNAKHLRVVVVRMIRN